MLEAGDEAVRTERTAVAPRGAQGVEAALLWFAVDQRRYPAKTFDQRCNAHQRIVAALRKRA